jgi:hypothetical protein
VAGHPAKRSTLLVGLEVPLVFRHAFQRFPGISIFLIEFRKKQLAYWHDFLQKEFVEGDPGERVYYE